MNVRSDMSERVSGDGARVDLDLLEALIGYRLRRASSAVNSHFKQAMGELAVRPVGFSLLAVIGRNPGIGQSELGRALGIQRANMAPLAADLRERGLVVSSASSDDRRTRRLTLTDAGERLLEDCLIRVRRHEDAVFAGLTDGERRQLLALLSKIKID